MARRGAAGPGRVGEGPPLLRSLGLPLPTSLTSDTCPPSFLFMHHIAFGLPALQPLLSRFPCVVSSLGLVKSSLGGGWGLGALGAPKNLPGGGWKKGLQGPEASFLRFGADNFLALEELKFNFPPNPWQTWTLLNSRVVLIPTMPFLPFFVLNFPLWVTPGGLFGASPWSPPSWGGGGLEKGPQGPPFPPSKSFGSLASLFLLPGRFCLHLQSCVFPSPPCFWASFRTRVTRTIASQTRSPSGTPFQAKASPKSTLAPVHRCPHGTTKSTPVVRCFPLVPPSHAPIPPLRPRWPLILWFPALGRWRGVCARAVGTPGGGANSPLPPYTRCPHTPQGRGLRPARRGDNRAVTSQPSTGQCRMEM